MSEPPIDDHAAPLNDQLRPQGRVSFERLRERTDELELIISGLSLFALLSLPAWLFESFQTYFARLPMSMAAAAVIVLPVLTAIAYVMAGLFVLHLAVRAHWVGLIGLKSVFPHGIRWERLSGIGPLTRTSVLRQLPDLDHGIAAADRLASVLFSLITFSAITLAILGGWMTLLFVLGGVFGNQLGGTNHFINTVVPLIILAMVGAPLVLWLIDGVLARRWHWLGERRLVRGLVWLAGRVERLFFPLRLVGSARLTLQSNTLPRLFFPLFVGAVVMVSMFGNQLFQQSRGFDVFASQLFVGGRDLVGGQRSQFYESQRVALDRMRPGPMIPAPVVASAWLPLFLPYIALIDDPVLRARCPPERTIRPPAEFGLGPDDSDAAAREREAGFDRTTAEASACLQKLWEVHLDGRLRPLDAFVVSERSDLGLRGLSGYLPLQGLQAGPHQLEVIWRPRPEQDRIIEDYVPRRIRYRIPFVWSPEAAAQPASPP